MCILGDMKKKPFRSTLHEVMLGRKPAKHTPKPQKRKKNKLKRDIEERIKDF
jgi:hypothetical protein